MQNTILMGAFYNNGDLFSMVKGLNWGDGLKKAPRGTGAANS